MTKSKTKFGGQVRARIAGIALATILAGTVPLQPAKAATVEGDPVLYWNQLLVSSMPANPVFASRHAAIFNIAVHDAVNAAVGNPAHSYLGGGMSGANSRAAASSAAYHVLKALYPANTATYDAAYNASLALVSDGAAKTAGIASGMSYANQILAQRATDGWNAVVPYTPSGEIGRWAPTPPGFGSAAVPQWGTVDPFLMTSGSQFRSGPPPALTSAMYTAAFEEVKAIGSAGSLLRSADQSAAANYWVAASGPGPWINMAISSSEGQGTSTLDNASTLARLSVAMMDATIGIFDAKYFYDYWRPVTAIRNADLDGNAATLADATWSSYVTTPAHPSYISGHSAVAGSAAGILANAFGDNTAFCLTWASTSRCWANYTAASEDAANSRLWGGIHWRFDNDAGLALGRSVADWTLHTAALGAVPEPDTWSLLILGFGTIGAALRRRRPERLRLRYR